MLFKISEKNTENFIILSSTDKLIFNKEIKISDKAFIKIDSIGNFLGNQLINIDLITKVILFTVNDVTTDESKNFLDVYYLSDNEILSLVKKTSPFDIQDYSKISIKEFNQISQTLPDYIAVELMTEKEYQYFIKK